MPLTQAAWESAAQYKDISVSEFFERNRHILGFDNPTRSLITAIKEAVDNSLDACEEAGILPELLVEVHKVDEETFHVIAEDNGPGIVKRAIPNVFAKLLHGSRFHSERQSRGQQGLGISSVVLYSQVTTGKPAVVRSRPGPDWPTVELTLHIDTKKNQADVLKSEIVEWDRPHGTRVEVELRGRYVRGLQSAYEYLRATSIVNPHARITFVEPDGTRTEFPRTSDKLPPPAKEIKPHPHGIELGQLHYLAKNSSARTLHGFLMEEFVRVGATTAKEIVKTAGLDEDVTPKKLTLEHVRKLQMAFRQVKILPPPTDCLSPIGEALMRKGLRALYPDAAFIATMARPPAVHDGHPFQVEAAVVYGGSLKADEPVGLLRFANRVPLIYQRGACATAQAVEAVDWRRYGLEQRGGKGWPIGPVVFVVELNSTNVPYTSESKDAVAPVEAAMDEVEKALKEVGRHLRVHLAKQARIQKAREKEELIRKILPRLAEVSARTLGRKVPAVEPVIARVMDSVLFDTEAEERDGHVRVTLRATNYTKTTKRFKIVLPLPSGAELAEAGKEWTRQDGRLVRSVSLKPLEKAEAWLDLREIGVADARNVDVFVDGIAEDAVSGADVWKEVEA